MCAEERLNGERAEAGVDGSAHAIESCGVGGGDELHVAENHVGVELEGDLRRVGAGIELAGCLRGRDLLGEQREPALAEGHGAVADGARVGVELAHRGDEEAAPREDTFLDVVEDGRIARIYVIRNPHKLGRLEEVAELRR